MSDKPEGYVFGRPTKYKPEMCQTVIDMMTEGCCIAEVCAKLLITRETFHKWAKDNKDFSDSYNIGRQLSEGWWSKLGRGGAMGQVPINAPTWTFNMKNRFNWRDKQDVDSTITPGGVWEMVEVPSKHKEVKPDNKKWEVDEK